MKKLLISAVLVVLGVTVLAQAQRPPVDPRDSVILESKTVAPGADAGPTSDTSAYAYIKVYITNKDSLLAIRLEMWEYSETGGAYMTLGWPRNINGVFTRLTNTLNSMYLNSSRYHSSSPDSFAFGGIFYPLDPGTIEPPNPVRRALYEIKFDSVRANLGTVVIDTGFFYGDEGAGFTIGTEGGPYNIDANFLKSTVTVQKKGDLNLDGVVSPADVVLELQCVFLGDIPPAGQSACDLNCDGQVTAADVTVMLNFKYLSGVWPC